MRAVAAPSPRSAAALLHQDQLLQEIRRIQGDCATAKGYYGPLNCYLHAYFDLMDRCPEHAKPAVSHAFLASARALGLLA